MCLGFRISINSFNLHMLFLPGSSLLEFPLNFDHAAAHPVLGSSSPPKQQEYDVPSELSKEVARKLGSVSGPGKLPKRI